MMRKQPPPPKKQTKSIQSQKKGRESEKLAPEIKKSPEVYFEDLQLEPHQEQIVSVVQEYLLRYNLLQTLETLQREILNGQMGQDSGRFDCDLLEFFEKGEQELFFAQWNKYIPYAARMRDEQIKKLEFYIQIYFLIYDIHPKTGKRGGQIPRNTIAFFKGYLESKGQELSKTNEFLHYYALPYVPKPQEHPSYKHLFSNQWLLEIKGSLVKTINDLQARDQPTVLEQICGQYEEGQPKKQNLSQSNQNYTTQLEINNQELLSVIQDYNLKYNQMQKKFRDYIEQSKQTMIEAQQKWYQTNKEVTDIAKELNKMLEESRNGKQIQQNKLDELLKKLTSLSKFFSTSVEEIISQSHDISLYDKGSIFDNDLSMSPIPQHVSQQNHFNFQNIGNAQNNANNVFAQLNYPKIQHFFLDPSTDPGLVCRVLQALRFRITTSKGARLRREILIQYAQFDIIGCTPRNAAVLQKLLVESSNQIKEFTLRLTNTMASDYQGRSYLMDSLQLIRILIDILKKEHTDSLVRRNALGALQKLSLRRKPQIVMIENDVIKWIVKTLKDEKDTLSEYSYEYATALFMNLSMRFQGKKKCEDFKQEVLKVLNDLLENENMQVRTFVNGTLYSLFSIQTLREQANAFGMNQRLNALMQTSDERFIRQIQYIIEQLNRDGPDEEENDEENDVDDIDDIDDSEDTIEEDDVEDALQNNKNELMGEDLLTVLFSLTQQEAQQQNSMTRSILQEQKKTQLSQQSQMTSRDQPFRPTTPVMNASQLQKSERSNPSEMKSRPKVMRTPVAQERNIQPQQQDQLQESQPVPQPIQPVLPKHDPPAYEQNPDYKQAFEHKPKLPRTPPGGKR